jgi:Alpha galactosidase A/Alpha galactosidase C-terminal beta sandwich domain/Alpha-galactosidase, CBM13 domain
MRPKCKPSVTVVAAILAPLVLSTAAFSAGPDSARPVPVPPPRLGWSSWNSFSNIVDSDIVMAQVRALVSNGMKEAGYQYINIDEGWWLGKRDADGNIVVEEKAWPAIQPGEKAGDMTNIVRFIHSQGLKAGIYTDAGKDGCSMYPDLGPKYFHTGSEGHYEQDFLAFARWGFDYVKVDWCGGDKENLDPAVQYAEIARAIARAEKITGHRLYFSLYEWGKQSPWTWAPHVGGAPADIWRTSGDIVDPIVAGQAHADRKADFDKMLGNFDQGIHPEAQHTGFYNDPDMMVIGMPGFSDAQNRVHMSLWAISGAPLLVGADLAKLSPQIMAKLTNKAVLAVDQDSLGLQAVKVAEPEKGVQVWSKPLAAAARAVLLLNRSGAAAEIKAEWIDLGLIETAPARVKDLWSGKDLGSANGSWSTQVPASDALLLLIEGKDAPGTMSKPDTSPIAVGSCRGCDVTSPHVPAKVGWARIRISYRNPTDAARYAELRINGQGPTSIAFPPAGAGAGEISVLGRLDHAGDTNVVTFSSPGDLTALIDAINVE